MLTIRLHLLLDTVILIVVVFNGSKSIVSDVTYFGLGKIFLAKFQFLQYFIWVSPLWKGF